MFLPSKFSLAGVFGRTSPEDRLARLRRQGEAWADASAISLPEARANEVIEAYKQLDPEMASKPAALVSSLPLIHYYENRGVRTNLRRTWQKLCDAQLDVHRQFWAELKPNEAGKVKIVTFEPDWREYDPDRLAALKPQVAPQIWREQVGDWRAEGEPIDATKPARDLFGALMGWSRGQ